MSNNPFKELTDESAKSFIEQLHQQYLNRINFYGIRSDDLNRFSWTGNKKLNLYIVQVYSDNTLSLFKHTEGIIFAIPSTKDTNKLLFADLKKDTATVDFSKKSFNPSSKLSWLVEKELLPDSLKNKIINSSLTTDPGTLNTILEGPNNEIIANNWVDKEYEETLGIESHTTPVTPFPTSHQHYFVDRYHFDDMLKIINNDQFTDELNQCLFAYEHEKWFLCASGLGSCLEHLLFLVLENYDPNRENLLDSFPKDPTGRHYIERFRRRPIRISRRQETYLNILFTARNAVDHHNTGYTQRNLCDVMINGISSVFNDYFIPSLQN